VTALPVVVIMVKDVTQPLLSVSVHRTPIGVIGPTVASGSDAKNTSPWPFWRRTFSREVAAYFPLQKPNTTRAPKSENSYSHQVYRKLLWGNSEIASRQRRGTRKKLAFSMRRKSNGHRRGGKGRTRSILGEMALSRKARVCCLSCLLHGVG
jgi:hypothetical protein